MISAMIAYDLGLISAITCGFSTVNTSVSVALEVRPFPGLAGAVSMIEKLFMFVHTMRCTCEPTGMEALTMGYG